MKEQSTPIVDHRPSPEELLVLEERWQKGLLRSRFESLLHFTDIHRDELIDHLGADAAPSAIISRIQELIIESGSAHLAMDLRDQIKEMQAEIWYRGEEGAHDPFLIKQEWTAVYARPWRQWRIKEYLFVAKRSQSPLAEYLVSKTSRFEKLATQKV
jgi:hypothetical protein